MSLFQVKSGTSLSTKRQINRLAAIRQSKAEPELTAVTPMLITLPNNVAEKELAAAAAVVVRPLFFF